MSSTGQKQTESNALNDMLRQVGIDDVGAFVNQFRNKVNQENAKSTSGQQPDLISMGSSFLNQFSGSGKKGQESGAGDLFSGAMNAYKMFSGNQGGNSGQGQGVASGNTANTGGNPMDMINNAMKVYKMFSGNKDTASGTNTNANTNTGGGSGGGNIFDTIGTAYGTAQQLQGFLKKLDRNGDGKVTIEDIQLLLEGLGLGSVSSNVSKALFKAVDRNGNGELDLPDVMALAAILSKLVDRFGTQKVNQQAQPTQP